MWLNLLLTDAVTFLIKWLTQQAESITMPEMNDKKQANTGQDAPLSVRLWSENKMWFADFAKIYSSTNAAFNIALMRAQGKGDFEIEQECAKHLRGKK
jgi:hypothetical protein